jgi:DTW domain-containing protein YfiP
MHRDEVYKSTNSGRLIADLFPDNTVAYLWSRTEPEPQLLAHLHNPKRQLRLLFPESSAMLTEENTESFIDNRPLTVVLIDGTWKQAGRIVRLSPWLSHLPRMSIQADAEQSGLYIRKALHSHQLSTAQSAACVLAQAGEADNATLLNQYFSVFNQHCIATRRGVAPTLTEAHHFLSARQSQTDSSLPSITQQGSIQLSNYQSRNPE